MYCEVDELDDGASIVDLEVGDVASVDGLVGQLQVGDLESG